MRPILIIPIPKIREEDLAEARRLNERDAKRGAVELDNKGAVIDDLEDRRERWRRCGLSKVVCMRSVDQSGLGKRKMGTPASLDTCENLIQMLLRRRLLSLPDRARNYRKWLLEFGYPATLPAAKAYPQVISGLLWEACWRGMSTALQVASPPLHTQTLTMKWWTSTSESLRFGPSEYLHGPSVSAQGIWIAFGERRRAHEAIRLLLSGPAPGFDRISGGREACAPPSCRRVTILLSGNTGNQSAMPGRKPKRLSVPAKVTELLRKSDDIALLHDTHHTATRRIQVTHARRKGGKSVQRLSERVER